MTRRTTALMVLRVWIEEGSSEPLRVHVRQTHDVARGYLRTLTSSDVDEVMGTVRRFLEDSRDAGAAGGDGHDDAEG